MNGGLWMVADVWWNAVLDSSTGRPVPDVRVNLQQYTLGKTKEDPDVFEPLARGCVPVHLSLYS